MIDELTHEQKSFFISKLANELLVLRAKAGLSQERLSNYIGISRQTYYAVETGQKQMSWGTFLALLFVFDCIPATKALLEKLEIYPEQFMELLRSGYRENRNSALQELK